MKKPLRILWLPTGGQIGDALMVLSVLAEFLAREPEGKVTYLVRRNAALIADLALSYPRIEIVAVPRNPFAAGILVAGLFLSERCVVVVPPIPGSQPKAVRAIAALFGLLPGNTVVGVRDRDGWARYTVTVPYDSSIPYVDNLRRQLRAAGIAAANDGSVPRVALKLSMPKSFALHPKRYIAIHPFPTLSSKTLPLRRWRLLLGDIVRTYPNLSLVITGSKENESSAKGMVSGLNRTQAVIGLPILEVASIIQNSALYIGVDTGITHLAGVMHHPSIVLAQRSSPTWLPTYNPNAAILTNAARCTCEEDPQSCRVEEEGQAYYRCLFDVSDETILAAIGAKMRGS